MSGSRPLRIGFIFEGPTDEETLPVLVAQLLGHPVQVVPLHKQSSGWDDFRRPSPEELRNGRRGARWGMFRSYVQALLIDGAEAIVVAADHDADEDLGQGTPFPYKRWCILARNLPFDREGALRLIDAAQLEDQEGPAHRSSLCAGRGLDGLSGRVIEAYDQDTVPVIVGIAVQMLEGWLLALPHVVESVLWDRLSDCDRARCVDPEAIHDPKSEIVRRCNGGDDLSRQQARQVAGHADFRAAVIEMRCPSFARFAQDVRALCGSIGLRPTR